MEEKQAEQYAPTWRTRGSCMQGSTIHKGDEFRCHHCGTIHPRMVDFCPETGKPIPAAFKYSGRVLDDKYQVEDIIGQGGMGVVYRGLQKNIKKKVAVKFFNPDTCTEKECVTRFVNEARFSASIGHANIINIIHFGHADEVPYIVMEFLDGESLGSLMQKERTLPPSRAIDIACQILDALRAVHASNIVHRDLKPENVFLARQTGGGEIVKLLDFGISCLMKPEDMSQRLREAGKLYGTPYYASPEQAEGRPDVDGRADVYSTGVLLYEMLTGRLPFRAKTYDALIVEILSKDPPDPSELSDAVSPGLSRIILKSLAKDPHRRYSTAGDMLEELKQMGDALEGNVFRGRQDEPGRDEEDVEEKQQPAALGRKRRTSNTGYSLYTPEEKLSDASPYKRARLRRSSVPPPPMDKKPGLSEEEKIRLESASSEILNILEGGDKAPPALGSKDEDKEAPEVAPRPKRATKPTPIAIPAPDPPDSEDPEVIVDKNKKNIDDGWD
jgi:serine/threonine protein kinase